MNSVQWKIQKITKMYNDCAGCINTFMAIRNDFGDEIV